MIESTDMPESMPNDSIEEFNTSPRDTKEGTEDSEEEVMGGFGLSFRLLAGSCSTQSVLRDRFEFTWRFFCSTCGLLRRTEVGCFFESFN
jgi:hypothetical protein